jgi:subtilisin family serine protease
MKASICLAGGVVVLLAGSLSWASPPPEPGVKVEPGVYAELRDSAQGTAYVIVLLRGSALPGEAALPQRQAAIRAIQGKVLAAVGTNEFKVAYQYKNVAAVTGWVSAPGLAKFKVHRDVRAIGTDETGHAQLHESRPFIGADDVHSLGYTGDGVTVAVLDTGIETDDPDLSDDIAAGAYHFLGGGTNTGPGAEDDNGHGTNVAAIITSKGEWCPLGIAPDADILPIKVLDSVAFGQLSDWTAGVDYVVDHKDDYDHLRVINMSLGSSTLYSQCPCDSGSTAVAALHEAIQAAKLAGIVTFAASGNKGSCTSMCAPACVSSAVAVAAVYDEDRGAEPDSGTYRDAYGSTFANCADATTAPDKITCFSNRSGCNELAAPGRIIMAPAMGDFCDAYTGTSQASPHCAATAALMLERDLTGNCGWLYPDLLVQIMKETGVPTTDPCGTSPDPIRVDALAAVNAVGSPYDVDHDGDVDLVDFARFQDCFTGDGLCPIEGACEFHFDFTIDCDCDVDLRDYLVFSSLYTGPGI